MTRAFFPAQRLRSAPLGSLALAKKSPSPSPTKCGTPIATRDASYLPHSTGAGSTASSATKEASTRRAFHRRRHRRSRRQVEASRVESTRGTVHDIYDREHARASTYANTVRLRNVTRICVRASRHVHIQYMYARTYLLLLSLCGATPMVASAVRSNEITGETTLLLVP